VRSSYYGRLNEQFLSTFIPSDIERIFPRAGEYSKVRAVRTLNENLAVLQRKHHVSFRDKDTQQAETLGTNPSVTL